MDGNPGFLKDFNGKYTVKIDDVIQSILAQSLFNSFLMEQTLKIQLEIKAHLCGENPDDGVVTARMNTIIREAEKNTAKSIHDLMIGMYLSSDGE